jgi:cyclopropane-fatty-acyl-phospholipid synthase
MSSQKQFAEELLAHADIQIQGDRPWDLQIHNEAVFKRVLTVGTLALGESYMDGWWDSKELDQFFYKIITGKLEDKVKLNVTSGKMLAGALFSKLTNKGSRKHSFEIGKAHYDIGNDLFEKMLDKRLVYTCGYWKDAKNLDEAQEAKLDLVCRKLSLKKGQKILDIGCGWGSFAKFAAEKYGVSVVGVTVSQEQVDLGRKLCEGLPIELRLQDYRDVNEKFDHIVSLGMFEHVGFKQYRTHMEVAERCLKDDGIFLLHTIGSNKTGNKIDPWMGKYIFPGGMLPSVVQIAEASEGLFIMEDWHNFSASYDKTLMAWYHNFDKAWPLLKDRYDERFYRMWKYYLLSCAAGFRARDLQLWQIVFTKHGMKGGYTSVR